MKKALLLVVLWVASLSAFCQASPDTIQVRKKLATTYLLHGEVLSPTLILKIMEGNSQAYPIMKKARRNATIATIFGYAGGFLIGYPLGTAIAGGDPEWALAGIGAGLVLVSIPFTIKYNKHAKQAVALYNRDLLTYAEPHKLKFSLGLGGNGLALTIKL